MNSENLGFDEVVDTAIDVIETARKVRDAIADGIDLTDVATIFSIAPRLAEVYRDRAVFAAQLADLTPEESTLAAAAIAARTDVPGDRAFTKVNEALILLARTHQEISDDIDLAQDWIEWGKSLRPDDAAEN